MYIKRSTLLPLFQVRRDMLRDMDVAVDYYPPHSENRHCVWVCTDKDCPRCGDSFNSYPAFKRHLKTGHNLQFSDVRIELLMRQKYHWIEH